MTDLVQRSLEIIRQFQQPSGAYPACPTMPDYQFCWFRDGSFIAHAMCLHKQMDSALAFHEWSAQTVLRYADGAKRAMVDFQNGKAPDSHDVLRARYTYDGGKGPDDWPEFQLDGLGTWLWALKAFQDRGQLLSPAIRQAAGLVADYLQVLWPSPCHDLWEEHGDQVHTYTLAAIYSGLAAAAELLGRPEFNQTAHQIDLFIRAHCTVAGHGFIKSVGVDLIDGSLPALAVPYNLISLTDPIMQATIKRVEADIYATGVGVHRYRGDSYYGGGAWLLLAGWLGWYYVQNGELTKARSMLNDISRFATANGELPEQIVPPMFAQQSDYDYWVKVRGPIATPLLWSHAMCLILHHACQ